MEELKLLYCTHCKKIVELIPSTHCCPTVCCGENMVELVPNTTEAATEKHIPVVSVKGNTVEVVVGSVVHPMTEIHYIQFIYLVTNKNVYRHDLKWNDEPKATFALTEGEEVKEVLAYCNLHGLWKK